MYWCAALAARAIHIKASYGPSPCIELSQILHRSCGLPVNLIGHRKAAIRFHEFLEVFLLFQANKSSRFLREVKKACRRDVRIPFLPYSENRNCDNKSGRLIGHMIKPSLGRKTAQNLFTISCIAGFLGIAASVTAETATFTFAPVGSSFSAFLPSDSPLIGKEIVSARIYLDVDSFEGSDAANFFTDISFPIAPDPGNTNALVLVGSDLGWSGSGTFHYFEETTGFNGVFVSARYGGETPGENFDGVLLDTSRIEFDYISDGGEGLTLESAASRKTHGHIGDFDLELPLSGDIGIESRSGNGKSEIVFTFNNNVTGFASASSTCGKLGKVMVDPTDTHSVLVRLNEIVCSQTVVTVVLTGVTDDQGHTLNSASVTFGVLFGDVTADGVVDKADIAAARAVQGQRTNSSNFRADITADGGINFRDVGEAKKHQGDALP